VETTYTAKYKGREAIQSRSPLFAGNQLFIDSFTFISILQEFLTVSGIFLVCFCFFSDCQAATEKPQKPEKPQKAEKKEQSIGYSGTVYGFIHNVQPDFSVITVKPIDNTDRRHKIYLDKSTSVFVDKKRKSRSNLYLGDKVAVRYFGRGTTIVADAVYVVFGEFVAKDYIVKKRLAVVKKDTDEKGKEGGGHGAEAKKDAKPKAH